MAMNIAANSSPTKTDTLAHRGHSAADGVDTRAGGMGPIATVGMRVDDGASDRSEVTAARVPSGGRRCSHSPGIIVDGLRTVIL